MNLGIAAASPHVALCEGGRRRRSSGGVPAAFASDGLGIYISDESRYVVNLSLYIHLDVWV